VSRVLFVDAQAGLAGDMLVAGLVHAGAELDAVVAEVRALGVTGWNARVERVTRGPYAATRFVVEPDGAAPPDGGQGHDHGHDHGHRHTHGHDHDHDHGGGGKALTIPGPFPGQPARDWATIRALLEGAPLRPRVRARALDTFGRLAAAEARVHGTPVDEVSFHEVGAVDSIVDVVGACAALEELGVERVVCTALPMGQGRVRTEHGLLPIPVPATVEVLRGFPVVPSPWSGELVTPTGAALAAALAEPGPMPAMVVEAVGYGAGTRDPPDHANIVRVVLGRGEAGALAEVVELRAGVDDLPGEAVPPLFEALFAAGALDAWATPSVGKKGRPGLQLGVLCAPEDRDRVGEALLRHSGSFGYRWERMAREVLARHHHPVRTAFGEVRIKVGSRAGAVVHAAAEYEDCAALARAAGRPVAEVMQAALAAWASR